MAILDLTLPCKYNKHTPAGAQHMLNEFESLEAGADKTAAMKTVVQDWLAFKAASQDGNKGLGWGTLSQIITDMKKYLEAAGRQDVGVHCIAPELRAEQIQKSRAIVDLHNSTKVQLDLAFIYERAVKVLSHKEQTFTTHRKRDNFFCKIYAALFVVTALRLQELLVKTTLTLCEGEPDKVMADRLQKGGEGRDEIGCKVGPFKIQLCLAPAALVLENFKLVREHLSCSANTPEKCRKLSNRVTTQLKKLFPELVQLFKSKSDLKEFSLHSTRHLKEAFCASKYKPASMARGMYRRDLFHHDGVATGSHYEFFDHVEGAPWPLAPQEPYTENDYVSDYEKKMEKHAAEEQKLIENFNKKLVISKKRKRDDEIVLLSLKAIAELEAPAAYKQHIMKAAEKGRKFL
jgi:hypothetical protein